MDSSLKHPIDSVTVLVVEDDPALLRLIQKHLNQRGHKTAGVTSGNSALTWLAKHHARLMLLDYSLPDMPGEDLLRKLNKQNLSVPFVVATGHGSEAVAVDMMRRGAIDYLIKESSFLKLLPTVIDDALARIDQKDELQQAHDQLENRVMLRTNQLAEANAKLRLEMNERKRAEEKLAQHQAELAHMNRLSMLGETVAELAHELNQPLSAIASHAQACARLLDSSAGNDTLLSSNRQISEQANRAGSIIRRLRSFVGRTKFTESHVNLNDLIREIVPLAEAEIQVSRFQVNFSLDDTLPIVHVDRIQIEQVLVNLIRNAVDAMQDSDTESNVLTLSTSTNGDNNLNVSVCDAGTGIPKDDLERVFDRFFTTKPSGMGMGLPISRSIVENHGGRLWVTPNRKRGVTFQFTLPISYGDQ